MSTDSRLRNNRWLSDSQAKQLHRYTLEFLSSTKGLIGIIIVLGLAIVALFAPIIAPYDPTQLAVGPQTSPPSFAHPFGTDNFGRDVFSRIIMGSRIALYVGTVSTALSIIAGVPPGAIGGYFGGYVDEAIMRSMDALMSFPPVLLGLVVVAALQPNLTNVLIAIGVVFTPYFARVTRSAVLEEKNREYVEAARARGENDFYIIFWEILPNAIAPIIVQASLFFGIAILSASALSFLGLGAQPPTPSWGLMISSGRAYLSDAIWIPIFPGLAIGIAVLGFNMLGDALRMILDPKVSTMEGS